MEFKDIYTTLSQVDLTQYLEKKMGLTYLSWANAWEVMMKHYPQATFAIKEPVRFDDGSMEVWTEVSISGHSRTMWLPVMDHRNQAIKNPSSRQVSDARMRCLVKNLAMFGLGLYVYQGEDLPRATQLAPQPQVDEMGAVEALRSCDSVKSLTETFKKVTKGFSAGDEFYKKMRNVAATKKGELINAAA